MMRRWLVPLAACASLSGCAVLLVGAGAAGGYAISRDSVKNVFDLPKEHVHDVSAAVLKERGVVKTDNRAHGQIKGEVQDVDILITIKPVTKQTVELKVRGRNRLLMPQVDTAQEIYNGIVERL